VEPVPLARRGGAWHYLDPRRARSHHRRRCGQRFAAEPQPAILRDRDRFVGQRVAGTVSGTAFFGYLTDRLGRKLLFDVTLGLYLLAGGAHRLLVGLLELCPLRVPHRCRHWRRVHRDQLGDPGTHPPRGCAAGPLVINGSFWIGAALGAAGSLVVLDPDILGADLGWRIAFGIGAVLGLIILYLRRFVPKSPRWLLIHGRAGEANRLVADIRGARRGGAGAFAAAGPLDRRPFPLAHADHGDAAHDPGRLSPARPAELRADGDAPVGNPSASTTGSSMIRRVDDRSLRGSFGSA
jgi:hypothetical protein